MSEMRGKISPEYWKMRLGTKNPTSQLKKFDGQAFPAISCNFRLRTYLLGKLILNSLVHVLSEKLFEKLVVHSFNRNSIHMTCSNPYHELYRVRLNEFVVKFETC